jgi:hypothetical protein
MKRDFCMVAYLCQNYMYIITIMFSTHVCRHTSGYTLSSHCIQTTVNKQLLYATVFWCVSNSLAMNGHCPKSRSVAIGQCRLAMCHSSLALLCYLILAMYMTIVQTAMNVAWYSHANVEALHNYGCFALKDKRWLSVMKDTWERSNKWTKVTDWVSEGSSRFKGKENGMEA